MVAQLRINEEMFMFHNILPSFCPSPAFKNPGEKYRTPEPLKCSVMFWPSEAEPSKFDSAQYFPAGNSVTM